MQPDLFRVLLLDGDLQRRDCLTAILESRVLSPVAITPVVRPEEIIPTREPSFDVALLMLSLGEGALASVKALANHLPHVPIVVIGGDVEGADPLALIGYGVQEHIPTRCMKCPGSPRLLSALNWAVDRSVFLKEIERMQQASVHRALHDSLTGLPDRRLFRDRLRHLLAQAARQATAFAVMFVDLDRFKQVNDTLGHDAGDHLLVEVARRLKDCLRETDTCARWGGDEFMVIVEGVHARDDAARVARKILKEIAAPLRVGGRELACGACIGISLHPCDGKDEEALIRYADVAMYRA